MKKKALKNILGKGENAGYQHFLLFPKCFPPYVEYILSLNSPLRCRLQLLSFWTGLKTKLSPSEGLKSLEFLRSEIQPLIFN